MTMGNDTSNSEHGPENARTRTRKAGTGSWAGPFSVTTQDDETDTCAVILDAGGQPYATVDAEHVGRGSLVGAAARATLIAEALNRDHRQNVSGEVRVAITADTEGVREVVEDIRATVAALEKSVTRYLTYPGTVVDHPQLGQLAVLGAGVQHGKLVLDVERDPGVNFKVLLDDVVPSGPMADAVRSLFNAVFVKLATEAVAKASANASLLSGPRPDDAVDCERCAATGICGACSGRGWTSDSVHHLSINDGDHVTISGGTRVHVDGTCPDCHNPLHECSCVPMDD